MSSKWKAEYVFGFSQRTEQILDNESDCWFWSAGINPEMPSEKFEGTRSQRLNWDHLD